jgi:hypothetical protein
MDHKPKTAYEVAMERLKAEDREAGGGDDKPLNPEQKERIAEARRVASARLAEREILFRDAMKKTFEPEAREKAEAEYKVDRQRIQDDCERAVANIRKRM